MTTAALIHHERSAADKLGAQAAIATHLAQECADQKAELKKLRPARARLLQKLRIERQRTRGAMKLYAEAIARAEKAEAEQVEYAISVSRAHGAQMSRQSERAEVAEARVRDLEQDKARIDCLARHELKGCVKGGPEDGGEIRVWAVSANAKWNLRQALDAMRVQKGEKL